MATFTTRLKTLVDAEFDLGLSADDYPIFDETYRNGLNRKILDHYANFEIGLETESMFKFALNRKMREIMPYYNQLYLSTQIEFDPLQTMNYADTSSTSNTLNSTDNSSGTATSDTTGKSRSVTSTTPQVQLSGNEDYASNAADVNSDTNVTGNTTGTSTRNDAGSGTMDRTVKGSQGPASDLLMRYRATFLNIDMQVIHDLATLFMQIWDNGDEFNNTSALNWGYGYDFGIL